MNMWKKFEYHTTGSERNGIKMSLKMAALNCIQCHILKVVEQNEMFLIKNKTEDLNKKVASLSSSS